MLIGFFNHLKQSAVPVTLPELLDLLSALEHRLIFADMDGFYQLSRAVLVKDEQYYDRFDQAFARYFNAMDGIEDVLEALIPDDWLRKAFQKQLTDEEKAKLESLGGLEELLKAFRERLEQQQERHEGGNRWIGTGGTSPFGQLGYNPEGIRVGPQGTQKRAVKVWDKREFKNLDVNERLAPRNMAMALKRLRKFTRKGHQEELDLDNTIKATASKAGLLDIHMRAQKRNTVKVLLLFDIGGSMDPYVHLCEQLFCAAKSEFKHMRFLYFHNFVYEELWRSNPRRSSEMLAIDTLIAQYPKDYKVIFVGDASMSPYEIVRPGGSVEYWNQHSGQYWFEKLNHHFDHMTWLNPVPEEQWHLTASIDICQQLMRDNMYPMTIDGLERAMASLM